MFQDKDIQHILHQFKSIQPNADFAQNLRKELLSIKHPLAMQKQIPTAELMNVRPAYPSLFKRFKLPQPLNAFAFAIASILVIFGVYTITRQLSPLFLPGLNQKGISAEAAAVEQEINIQLSHIDYFQQTSAQSAEALKQVTEPNLDHLNETLIKHEADSVQESATQTKLTNEQINADLQNMFDAITQ